MAPPGNKRFWASNRRTMIRRALALVRNQRPTIQPFLRDPRKHWNSRSLVIVICICIDATFNIPWAQKESNYSAVTDFQTTFFIRNLIAFSRGIHLQVLLRAMSRFSWRQLIKLANLLMTSMKLFHSTTNGLLAERWLNFTSDGRMNPTRSRTIWFPPCRRSWRKRYHSCEP